MIDVQAIVLDIFLILPEVLGGLFNGINGPPTGTLATQESIHTLHELMAQKPHSFVYTCTCTVTRLARSEHLESTRFRRRLHVVPIAKTVGGLLLMFSSKPENHQWSDVTPATGGPMLEAQILYYNTAFFFVYFCVAYGSLMCLAGKKASLPFVSEAAERQSGGGGGM